MVTIETLRHGEEKRLSVLDKRTCYCTNMSVSSKPQPLLGGICGID